MTSHPIARIALRIVPVAALAALAGCIAVPVGPGPGYGPGYGYGYAPAYPAPMVVVPAYRPLNPYPFRPWGAWR